MGDSTFVLILIFCFDYIFFFCVGCGYGGGGYGPEEPSGVLEGEAWVRDLRQSNM